MSQNKIYTSDINTEIILDTLHDISQATVTKIAWKNDEASGEWPATIVDDTKVRVINTNAWGVEGTWYFQPVITLPDWSGRGETYERVIYPDFG